LLIRWLAGPKALRSTQQQRVAGCEKKRERRPQKERVILRCRSLCSSVHRAERVSKRPLQASATFFHTLSRIPLIVNFVCGPARGGEDLSTLYMRSHATISSLTLPPELARGRRRSCRQRAALLNKCIAHFPIIHIHNITYLSLSLLANLISRQIGTAVVGAAAFLHLFWLLLSCCWRLIKMFRLGCLTSGFNCARSGQQGPLVCLLYLMYLKSVRIHTSSCK
jgi:hypothetical protein